MIVALPLGVVLLWSAVAVGPLSNIPSNWRRHGFEVLAALVGLTSGLAIFAFFGMTTRFAIGVAIGYCALAGGVWLVWRRQRRLVDEWARRKTAISG